MNLSAREAVLRNAKEPDDKPPREARHWGMAQQESQSDAAVDPRTTSGLT
jgi:hypothetical protein